MLPERDIIGSFPSDNVTSSPSLATHSKEWMSTSRSSKERMLSWLGQHIQVRKCSFITDVFENHEINIQAWGTYRSTIATSFAVFNNWQRLSSGRLVTQAQHKYESNTAYNEDVFWLFRMVNFIIKEEKLFDLMKGVVEYVFQFLIAKWPSQW